MDKVDVNGKDAMDLYSFLKVQSGNAGTIKWNFTKFVVARDGKTVSRQAAWIHNCMMRLHLTLLLTTFACTISLSEIADNLCRRFGTNTKLIPGMIPTIEQYLAEAAPTCASGCCS